MTDRPINLKAHEVVAILQGRKTQHRVAVNVEKYADYLRGYVSTGRLHAYYGNHRLGVEFVHAERGLWDGQTNRNGLSAWYVPVPFHAGQRLWCRERGHLLKHADDHDPHTGQDIWRIQGWHFDDDQIIRFREHSPAEYIGDCSRESRSPAQMPRWASRLTLLVTDVRVERLQAISRSDCYAEGCFRPDPTKMLGSDVTARDNARNEFRKMWSEIHGPDAWARNDWVTAISFRPIRANIDAPEAQAA